MPEKEIIRALRTSSGEAPGLPSDLLQKASRRLGIAALLYAGCYFLSYTISFTTMVVAGDPYHSEIPLIFGFPITHFVAATSILISLGMFFIAWREKISPQLLCDLGLIYEVIGAIGIDFSLTFTPIPPEFVPSGISWVCVWLILFVLIVPASPGKALIATLVTASVSPFLLLVGMARGTADPSTAALIQLFLPNYLCAGMAFVGSRIVYEMGTGVSEARRMGSYQLVELLGRGGMGEVWQAKHRMLVRPAAIKLIRPEALGGDGSHKAKTIFRRFEREAQATAALRSTHTITLYDFGITDDGVFYYVMELLKGLDLETLVERFGPIPPNRTIFLLQQVCHSLGDAHQQGFLHRDIKPANIYVSRLGPDFDFVKVLDFGLVKSHQEHEAGATQLTGQGVTTGTPGYMAPEVAMGAEKLDARVDLYALGCVGYWLLTGQLVFPTKSPMEMVVHHVQTPPVPPSQHSEFLIPPSLDEIILSCLEKDPEKRPPNAQTLSSQLGSCLSEEFWSQDLAEKWWRTHRPDLVNPDYS